MEIRKATMGDMGRIQELNKKLFEKEYDEYDKTLNVDWPLSKGGEKFYSGRIKKGFAYVLVDGDNMIGYLTGSLTDDEFYRDVDVFAELDDMIVLEEYRGRGYGGLLYDEFMKWCKEKGVQRIKALVTAKNKQGIEFYKKKGFEDYNVTLELGL